eukprot:Skav221357  [mRNA]  locus=scaffold2286:24230:25714:+ [translate_table: standard]
MFLGSVRRAAPTLLDFIPELQGKWAGNPSPLWRQEWKPAKHWAPIDGTDAVQCMLSPRRCKIPKGKLGFCKMRGNPMGNELQTLAYGTSMGAALEGIETEAVFHFRPGAAILSLANVGCDKRCIYCHNWAAGSQVEFLEGRDSEVTKFTPEQVVDLALEHEIEILSWTYNDPVVWHEFVCKTAALGRKHGLVNLYKSAFGLNSEPVDELLDCIDIFSISLKTMDPKVYRKITGGGSLQPTLDGAKRVFESGKAHLELSELVVTDVNDTAEEARRTAKWVLEELSPDVPLHIVRFHPSFKYLDKPRTPVDRLQRFRRILKEEGLKHVYLGNVYERGTSDTHCLNCGHLHVSRFGLTSKVVGLDEHGMCLQCGTPGAIVQPHQGRSPLEVCEGNPFEIFAGDDLKSRSVTWNDEVNSVHVVLTQKRPIVLLREPMMSYEVIKAPLGRVILSKSATHETGLKVFAESSFDLFPVLDRAHFPVSKDEEDLANKVHLQR